MALSTKRLYYYKNATQAINLYTSLSDIPSGQALQVRDSSGTLYAALGSTGDSNATNLRVHKGGTTYAVLSAAAATYLKVGPYKATYCPTAFSGATVLVRSNGPWTATSSVPWMTITSGASGNGNGSIVYSLTTNGTGSARQGYITVTAGALESTQTVGQQVSGSGLLNGPIFMYFDSSAWDNVPIRINRNEPWTATANDPSITILTPSGSGVGYVYFNVQQNTSGFKYVSTILYVQQASEYLGLSMSRD